MARKTEGEAFASALARIVGRRVRARRASLGISQVELSGLAEHVLGRPRSHSMVSDLERGTVEPELSELVALMFALGMTFQEITEPISGETEPLEVGAAETLRVPVLRRALAGKVRVRVEADGTLRVWTVEDDEEVQP